MAKKDKPRKTKSDKTAEPRRLAGMPSQKWREITGFTLSLLAVLLLLALISDAAGQRWIGSLGRGLAAGAVFVLGRVSAFVLPLLLGLAAFHAFTGRSPFRPLRHVFSGLLILGAFCSILTLPHRFAPFQPDAEAAFKAGGLVGNFFTSPDGLNLARRFGPVGSWIVFPAVLILGIMLATDFVFAPMVARGLRSLRGLLARIRKPRPVAVLKFDRHGDPRIFGADAKDKKRKDNEGELRIEPDKTPAEPTGEPAPLEGSKPEEAELGLTREQELEALLGHPDRAKQTKGKTPTTPMEMVQTELDFASDNYILPSLDLLSEPPETDNYMDREEIVRTSTELEQTLEDFNISARVVGVTQGPVVTQYQLQPAPGVKVSRILNLENDIALVLKAKSVRIEAPIPGKAAIGIEVPNKKTTPVHFKELVATEEFRVHSSPLAFVLGKNISGEPIICDLAAMPHLLIAGTTGSGKSVCVNGIISSILYRMPPDKVKFIMIDPKRVELNVYSDIPHLLAPVVNEPRQAAAALLWGVQQMEERLRIFSDLRVRNIDGYNALATGKRKQPAKFDPARHKYLPHIVIIIDELADLMLTAKNEVEEFIVRLAQMSRAAGIHMIIATQRPSVNVITGIIKANFPSRVAFRVSAKVDSRTILDRNGAETLLGRGDMLFSPGGTMPMRIQGAFLSDHDVEVLTEHLREQTPVSYEQAEFKASMKEAKEALDGNDGVVEGSLPGGEAADGDENEVDLGLPKTSNAPRVQTELEAAMNQPKAHHVEFPDITLDGDVDEDEILYNQALRLVLETKKPSVSMIQRRLKIGFARAGRLMDLMEERGIVGPYVGSKPRDLILDDPDGLLQRLNEIEQESSV